MSIHDYIEKLRSKPVHERQRIAAVATGIAFSVIFLIWVVSFSEMNSSSELQAEEQTNPTENFNENSSIGRASIEEMLQGLPSSDGTDSALGTDNLGTDNSVTEGTQGEGAVEGQSQNTNSPQDNRQEIPSLP